MEGLAKRLPDDILVGFFAGFPKHQKFRVDLENFNRFFYEMKSKYPSLLECLSFRQREFPESQGLEQAYFNLTACGFLQYSFNDLLHEAKKELCKKESKRFLSPTEIKKLRSMAMEYVKRFGAAK